MLADGKDSVSALGETLWVGAFLCAFSLGCAIVAAILDKVHAGIYYVWFFRSKLIICINARIEHEITGDIKASGQHTYKFTHSHLDSELGGY